MKLQPITYHGRTVAAATPLRFFLADELQERPVGDPETVFVCYMCAYAREVLRGRLPGPYSEQNARRFARAALIPAELLEREHIDTRGAAAALRIPPHELAEALTIAQATPSTSAAIRPPDKRRLPTMSAPYNPETDVNVSRGAGLQLRINGRPVEDTYGAIVMAELAQLRDFPAVRVELELRVQTRPTPAAMAQLIAVELDRNEIWD